MIVVKKSPFTGKRNMMDIDVTQDQLDRHEAGELIQFAMPNLTDNEREFLLTGITPEEWELYMGEGDEDE